MHQGNSVSRTAFLKRALSPWLVVGGTCLLAGLSLAHQVQAKETTPEEVLRTLVRANEGKDLATMARLMAQDPDQVSYSIGGRKYVGWKPFAEEMKLEFDSVTRLEIPITKLQVWTRGDTAWFAMELDYIRYVGTGPDQSRTLLPLRETGVLERRDGNWILVAWHESFRTPEPATQVGAVAPVYSGPAKQNTPTASHTPDLSGEWDIHEEDKSYRATLDQQGNGPYTWKDGRIATTGFSDRLWQGTWHQPGNDREGGFEVLLSEDGMEARGVWWYTRVEKRANIPPREWGGSYVWKRVTTDRTTPSSLNTDQASTPHPNTRGIGAGSPPMQDGKAE